MNSLPDSPGSISGPRTVCKEQIPVVYTVPEIPNAISYIWSLPTGAIGASTTNSITVTYGPTAISGNITVKGKNGCGKGPASTYAVTVNTKPSNAGQISGNTSVCKGQSIEVYTVPTIANATSYLWTLPTGATGLSTTNSITVSYWISAVSGNITVKGHNDCGDGVGANLAIFVDPSCPSLKNGSLLEKGLAIDLADSTVYHNGIQFTVYPNPFTSEITIEVWNTKKTEVDVAIYNLLGQRIKNLYNAENEGQLLLKWDGTSDSGQKVVPGIYLCKVNNETKKVFFKDGK